MAERLDFRYFRQKTLDKVKAIIFFSYRFTPLWLTQWSGASGHYYAPGHYYMDNNKISLKESHYIHIFSVG